VLHGYSRPGHGYVEGECPGRGAEPFELSKDLTEKFKRERQDKLQTTLAFIEKLKTGTVTFTLLRFRYRRDQREPEAVQISPGWRDVDNTYERELKRKIHSEELHAHSLVEDIKYLDERLRNWKFDPQKLIDGRPRKIGVREEAQQAAAAAVLLRNQERDAKEKEILADIEVFLSNQALMDYMGASMITWLEKARLNRSQTQRIQEFKSWNAEAKRQLAKYRRSRPEEVDKATKKIQQLIREIEAHISNERLEAYMRGLYEGHINMSTETNYFDHEVMLFKYRRDNPYFSEPDARVRVLKMSLKTFKQFAAEASPPIKVAVPK